MPSKNKAKKMGVRLVTNPNKARLEMETRRASAFSIAESFDFRTLLAAIEAAPESLKLMPFIADDVFHVALDPSSQTPPADPDSDAFFFDNGVFVTWGASDSQIEKLLNIANKVGLKRHDTLELEWFDYITDADQLSSGGIVNDTIVLGSDLPRDQSKLAYSSGLARSAKLASLENLLDAHLDKNRTVPSHLLLGKRLPFGRTTILQNLGEIYSLRGRVNLHSELLDLPDFCWSSSRMEDAFSNISRNLDVRARIAIFNKKLDYANELAEVVRNHLHEEHSLKLEWMIIWLISIAIGFETLHYFDRIREKPVPDATEETSAVQTPRVTLSPVSQPFPVRLVTDVTFMEELDLSTNNENDSPVRP
ncbi:hypothetical protein BC830DRAFT_1115767 [Chytriomyces sp. MP71]|nr:hypothetical protein BC830DRAFT_1115767 [Chytriomyces sp. MP71]